MKADWICDNPKCGARFPLSPAQQTAIKIAYKNGTLSKRDFYCSTTCGAVFAERLNKRGAA